MYCFSFSAFSVVKINSTKNNMLPMLAPKQTPINSLMTEMNQMKQNMAQMTVKIEEILALMVKQNMVSQVIKRIIIMPDVTCS